MKHFEGDLRAPEGARFATIIAELLEPAHHRCAGVAAARDTFVGNGVDETSIDVVRVPGAWELPMAAREVAVAGRHAAIVALGCVVRGDTRPLRTGRRRCVRRADAGRAGHRRAGDERRAGGGTIRGCCGIAGGSHGNKGEAALVAIEMADLCRKLKEATA